MLFSILKFCPQKKKVLNVVTKMVSSSYTKWSKLFWVHVAPQNCPVPADLWLGRRKWQLKVWLFPLWLSLHLSTEIINSFFLLVSREEQQVKEKVCGGSGGKRKLISGEVSGRKLVNCWQTPQKLNPHCDKSKARKEGVEGSKAEEEGVTLKSEPLDIGAHFTFKSHQFPRFILLSNRIIHIILRETVAHESNSGPTEYPSFPARGEPEVSRKSPGPRLQVESWDEEIQQQPVFLPELFPWTTRRRGSCRGQWRRRGRRGWQWDWRICDVSGLQVLRF